MMSYFRTVSQVICLAAALLVGASECSAAIITYTSSTGFFSALGGNPFFTEDYESFPINSTIPAATTLNGITYTAFPVGTDGRIDNIYNRLGNSSLALQRGLDDTSYFFAGESFTVNLPYPVFAAGIFFNVGISPVNSLFIQTSVGTATTGGATYDQSTLYFAGLISDTPFSTATIGGDANIGSGFNVDNLTFAASVPEPATFAVLAIGALGMMFARRKRPRT